VANLVPSVTGSSNLEGGANVRKTLKILTDFDVALDTHLDEVWANEDDLLYILDDDISPNEIQMNDAYLAVLANGVIHVFRTHNGHKVNEFQMYNGPFALHEKTITFTADSDSRMVHTYDIETGVLIWQMDFYGDTAFADDGVWCANQRSQTSWGNVIIMPYETENELRFYSDKLPATQNVHYTRALAPANAGAAWGTSAHKFFSDGTAFITWFTSNPNYYWGVTNMSSTQSPASVFEVDVTNESGIAFMGPTNQNRLGAMGNAFGIRPNPSDASSLALVYHVYNSISAGLVTLGNIQRPTSPLSTIYNAAISTPYADIGALTSGGDDGVKYYVCRSTDATTGYVVEKYNLTMNSTGAAEGMTYSASFKAETPSTNDGIGRFGVVASENFVAMVGYRTTNGLDTSGRVVYVRATRTITKRDLLRCLNHPGQAGSRGPGI